MKALIIEIDMEHFDNITASVYNQIAWLECENRTMRKSGINEEKIKENEEIIASLHHLRRAFEV